MYTQQYMVPLPYLAEDNQTLIAKKVIRVLDCSGNLGDADLCSMWNFSHCPTDRDYCNPFVTGDIIYLQKKIGSGRFEPSSSSFNYNFPKVIDVATGLPIPNPENYLTIEYGSDNKYNRYLNIIVDTSGLGDEKCFYITLKAFSCILKGAQLTSFNQCVNDLMLNGKTLAEAQEICLENYCSPITAFSEPYCKINDCVNTIMLEGQYPVYDCEGNYYGDFNSGTVPNSFKLQIRTYGEIFRSQFDISETLINNNRRKTKLISSYQLMTKLVPEYVAVKIAYIFAAKNVFIEGVEYEKTVIIPKNTERGKMWFISATVIRSCDEIDFSCQ